MEKSLTKNLKRGGIETIIGVVILVGIVVILLVTVVIPMVTDTTEMGTATGAELDKFTTTIVTP